MVVRWIVLGVVMAAVAAGAALALGSSSPADTACRAEVDRGVLPKWARTGFSDPEPRIAHVIGERGKLAAILFTDPLTEPPRPEEATNKILWVARRTPPPGPLGLTVERDGRTLTRTVETGPGPSTVDLPAGCWHVTARWPGGEDELELSYAAR